jgi:hypothetical protein
MLKLEPREAGNVVLCRRTERTHAQEAQIASGLDLLRTWRHYAQSTRDLFVDYSAPALEHVTRRLAWSSDSPAFNETPSLDYEPRLE